MTRIAAAIVLLAASVANAQIVNEKPVPARYACVDMRDAYKLALADIDGTLSNLVASFNAESRCWFMRAKYVLTLDHYLDSQGTPSRVIQMTVYGEPVWGITSEIPEGTSLISYRQ